MNELADRAAQAHEKLTGIVDRVCGQCGNSCCHQGTMMGTHDARRLVRGMHLEEGRETAVREGLRNRAEQLRADLETLRGVAALLQQSAMADERKLAELSKLLDDWEQLCEYLEGPWAPTAEGLHRMLRFAGVWALTLRAVGAFPGGHAALSTLAKEGSGFRFRGRRLAPPRCLFHDLQAGCVAGRWKPGKCANFFCSGEPNLLRELRQGMSFDEFVLGNAEVVSADHALDLVRGELSLGREFAEPKVFIGLPEEHTEQLGGVLTGAYGAVDRSVETPESFTRSVFEWEKWLERVDPDHPVLVEFSSVNGPGLYELAIAVDMPRARGEAVPLVVAAHGYASAGPVAHPLWADEEMGQPLGVLDLYVIDA